MKKNERVLFNRDAADAAESQLILVATMELLDECRCAWSAGWISDLEFAELKERCFNTMSMILMRRKLRINRGNQR